MGPVKDNSVVFLGQVYIRASHMKGSAWALEGHREEDNPILLFKSTCSLVGQTDVHKEEVIFYVQGCMKSGQLSFQILIA